MKVLLLCWLGIPSQEYEPMVRLFRDVMGLRVEFEEATTPELSLPSGDRVQLFAPGDPYFAFFREHARGPVALFEVPDRVIRLFAWVIAVIFLLEALASFTWSRQYEWWLYAPASLVIALLALVVAGSGGAWPSAYRPHRMLRSH
jgi:hypothetical protein